MQWAETKRCAAYWAGWTAVATEVRQDAGHETLADLLEATPQAASQLAAAREGLAAQGIPISDGAALSDALGRHWKQRAYITTANNKKHEAHRQQLGVDAKAILHSAGGPGAGEGPMA